MSFVIISFIFNPQPIIYESTLDVNFVIFANLNKTPFSLFPALLYYVHSAMLLLLLLLLLIPFSFTSIFYSSAYFAFPLNYNYNDVAYFYLFIKE